MKRTYTEIGKQRYAAEAVDEGIKSLVWEDFRTRELPFFQGQALNEVIKCLKICVANIKRMALHGCIVAYNHGSREEHGLYGLYVSYKNGNAKIYIADEGLVLTIVATDFDSKDAL